MYLRANQVMDLYQITDKTLRRWRRDGIVKAVNVGTDKSPRYRYLKSSLPGHDVPEPIEEHFE